MAQHRRYFDDVSYGEAHRYALPALYKRIGHRLDTADRDWTEFCHYCKKPLSTIETVRDVGQDVRDKATTVTRKIAEAAGLRGFLAAWRCVRPPEVEARINELGRELMELQTRYPITGFQVRELCPLGDVVPLSPDEWWEVIAAIHRSHHDTCASAQRSGEPPLNIAKFRDFQAQSRVWSPTPAQQMVLEQAPKT
jgi:hypothetical protein